mgnify:CR=1 FL=1
MFRGRAHRLHFVGIGGTGMSGIAEVLANLGYDVRGSDAHLSPVTTRLEALGIRIYGAHASDNVGDADVVVVSTAIKRDNPEVLEARRNGIPVIRRAEMLAELMRMKYGIAVAGTHGKTTTTSLVATILDRGGIDPTVVIGGRLKSLRTGARLGEGEYLVAEADESDGSFLRLVPTIAVITNIDAEHLDHWSGGLPQIVDAFVDFANKVPFYGAAVVCLDHPTVQSMLPRIEKRVLTYGTSLEADYAAESVRVETLGTSFEVRRRGEALGRVRLGGVIGRHNVLNALAAIAVGEEVGVPFGVCVEALAQFEGIGRRFERKGEVGSVLVVDDYGHHPAEIVATLAAAREAHARRLVVAFQPHRHTRTQLLWDDFATAFDAAHTLVVADIYGAGETPIEGVSARTLAQAITAHGHRDATYVGSVEQAATRLRDIVRPGDLVVTLGAGDIWQAGEELLAYLATTSERPWLPDLARIAGLRVQPAAPLASRTSLRIGGPAEVLCTVERLDALVALWNVVERHALALTIVGGGTNLLVSDDGIDGVVLELGGDFDRIEEHTGTDPSLWYVGAACATGKLVRRALQRGLAGVEVLAGVPGTVGGALIMNAGGHSGAIAGAVHRVHVLVEGRDRWLSVDEAGFGYRTSSFPRRALLLGAELRLRVAADIEAVRREVREAQARRRQTQPLTLPNAGSIFKNPPGEFAGRLIEQAGCKGWREGDAVGSMLHANFIVNEGAARARDVWQLMGRVRGAVEERFGVTLELEIRALGTFAGEEGRR